MHTCIGCLAGYSSRRTFNAMLHHAQVIGDYWADFGGSNLPPGEWGHVWCTPMLAYREGARSSKHGNGCVQATGRSMRSGSCQQLPRANTRWMMCVLPSTCLFITVRHLHAPLNRIQHCRPPVAANMHASMDLLLAIPAVHG